MRDGLDALGYHFFGSMNFSIRPLYRTRAFGIARTVRYLPYRGGMEYKNPRDYRDNFTPFYYNEVCTYPWTTKIEDGDGIVVVPNEIAQKVAEYAHEEHKNDKKNRRKLYADAGLKDDGTI